MRKRIKKIQDFPSNQSESNKKSRKNRNATASRHKKQPVIFP